MPSAASNTASKPVEPTKVCKGPCGQRKAWSAFYRTGKGHPDTFCKRCKNARRAEHFRAHPELKAEQNRAHHERMMADPERAAIRREQKRSAARRRNGTPASRYLAERRKVPVDRGRLVDPAPFAGWLAGRVTRTTRKQLAMELGMPERLVRALLLGEQDMVYLSTVDAALTAAGDVDALNDLYPV